MTRARILVAAVLAVVAAAVPVGAAGTAELMRCQKGIHTRASVLAKLTQAAVSNCAGRVEACKLAQELDGEDPTQCLAAASTACATFSGKVPAYKSAAESKAVGACNVVPFADLAQWVAGLGMAGPNASCGAGTVFGLLGCVFDDTQCAAEHLVFVLDPRAADALSTAGVAGNHPCVGP